MKLSDLIGEVKISSYHARSFINAWFSDDDRIVIVGRKSEKTGRKDTLSQSMLVSEFLSSLDDEFLDSLVFGEDGVLWNIYFGVYPIKEDVALLRRGDEGNIARVTGVWVDLDVKEGAFSSQQEILEFLYGLVLKPTIVVSSGSGGLHAYWKLAPGESGDKELISRWWSYLDEEAGDRTIDKLTDLTRIFRLPGTVYFPKEGTGGKIGAVEIRYLTPENAYTVQQITEVSQAAFDLKHERRKALINSDANRRMDMDAFARDMLTGLGGNKWRMWRAISELEGYVNDHMTWEEILTPFGWTYLRDLSDGSKEFARPGRNERSAVTDYEGSPVMSLLSMSEETGLADIKDAGIPITRYRGMLRLWFHDDEAAMIKYLVNRLVDEGLI